MTIRPFRETDRLAIAALQAESWRAAYRDVLPAGWLRDGVGPDMERRWRDCDVQPGDVVLVDETKDGLTGFIAVWCRPDPYIDNLHVLPSLRGGGIGRKLLAAAAIALTGKGHGRASLRVFTQNAGAIRLYERLGGRRAGTEVAEFFGHPAQNLRIVFDDLGSLAERAAGR